MMKACYDTIQGIALNLVIFIVIPATLFFVACVLGTVMDSIKEIF
jgi:hypothetical protein